MRIGHSFVLASMLLRFFSRKVLRLGVLRSATVRVLALVTLGVLLLAGVAGGYAFFRPMVADDTQWGLLFDLSTVSVVLWAQMAFLLVKVLFLNADALLDLSFHLPLTNRERTLAFLVYEAVMAGIVATAGFISLIGAALLLRGPAVVPALLESVVLPMMLTYAVMTVAYLALGRLALALGLRRIRNVLLVLAVFAVLLAYAAQLPHLTAVVSDNYLAGRDSFVWVTALSWLSDEIGSPLALLAGLGALLALVAVAVVLTPNEHVRHSRFVNVPTGRRLRAVLSPYDLCLVRSTQTWLGVAVAGALYTALALSGLANPVWALSLLSIGGLYQFAATGPLRALVASRSSAWVVYARLVRGPVGLVVLGAVPATGLLWLTDPDQVPGAPLALAGSAAGAVVAIGIGVIFPAENDNPFSVFVGLSVTAAVMALVGVSLGILQAPPVVLGVVAVGCLALLSWYSVQGIRIDESRRRHEEVPVGRQHGGRRRPADLGERRGHPALTHAVDR